MKKIIFTIKPDGTVTEELSGFTGNECETETAQIEQALGYVTDRKRTGGEDQYRGDTVRQRRG